MRSPEAALIRARAKAPLPDLLVLHLSNADIECIKHLELCKNLHSLYADSNHIKYVEGIIELRKLWRIDLNGNLLKNLHALASFRVLGFLYLERNRICFEDLVCLRDQYLLEVRLLGNDGLLKGNTVDEYRKKVVALLPNAWILDGHFISTAERQQAIEEFDSFVVSLFNQPNRSTTGDSKFGSATDMYWVKSDDTVELTPAASLIDIAHKPSHPNEPPDLRRLYAIVSFHNAESVTHNTHCHFAPSRHAPNSRLMPKIWLDEVLALPRRTRIQVIVLLAAFLQFQFPKVLLFEALTIMQLDSPHFPSEAIRDIVNLPPYALVALITIARHVSLHTEQQMREELKPEVATPEFKDESELLRSIPPLFTTLLSTKSDSTNPVDDSATTTRSRRAIKLLSNVASFPDPETVASKGKGKREAIFRDLMPLIRAAELGSENSATQGAREVVIPCGVISNHKTALKSPIAINASNTTCVTAQNCEKLDDTADVAPEADSEVYEYISSLDRAGTTSSSAKRRPKPGDWIEVYAKQFVKVQFLSSDGLFVVGSLPTNASRSITLSLEQMSRSSNSVWRVNYLTKQQADEISASAQHTNSDISTVNSTRLGKLHRDSEAFHRHGAARNQGFPNHLVTVQMVKDLDREQNNSSQSSNQPKAIEIFSCNDTLDANYVLTSPEHISAQNYCAVNTFLQQRLPPRGLWSPVKQCSPYSVLSSPAPSLATSSSLKELKTMKPRATQTVATAPQPQQVNDWHEIRRAMQMQLGIEDNDRHVTSSRSDASDAGLQTCSGVSVFLTVTPDCAASAVSPTIAQAAKDCIEEQGFSRLKTPPPLGSSSSQKLAIGGGTKLAASRGWHQVAIKTEFVVAAPLGVSHSAPMLRQLAAAEHKTSKLKLVLPSISQKSK